MGSSAARCVGTAAAIAAVLAPSLPSTLVAHATTTTRQERKVVHDPAGDAATDRPGPPGLRAYDDVRRVSVVPGSKYWKIAFRAQAFTSRIPANNTVNREIWFTYHTSTKTNEYWNFRILTAVTPTPPEPYFRQVPGHPKLYENNTTVWQWDTQGGGGCTFWIVPQPRHDRWLIRIPSRCMRRLNFPSVVSGNYSREASHSDDTSTTYADHFAERGAIPQ